MTVADLLKELEYYDLGKATLRESIMANPDQAMAKIRTCVTYNPEYFSQDVMDLLVSLFDIIPSSVFSILHKFASKYPERKQDLMDIYLNFFGKYPKEAIDDAYYACANHPELITKRFIDCILEHMAISPFNVIMTFQHVLVKRPEFIDETIVEAVMNNISKGANQAFYFLRDVSKKFPKLTPLCTLALFECVIAEHHYYVKREMLRDIIIIAQLSHIQTSLEKELKKPIVKGNKAAQILMALIFRQRYRVQQRVLLDSLDYAANWVAPWDFLIILLDNIESKNIVINVAEKFLEGIYRLGFILNPVQFENLIMKKIEFKDIAETKFEQRFSFLNTPELIDLYSKVKEFSGRIDLELDLKPLNDFDNKVKNIETELDAIKKIIKNDENPRVKDLKTRARNLEKRLKTWKEKRITKKEKKQLEKDIKKGLSTHLAQSALNLIDKVKKEALHDIALRLLGDQYNPENIDENIFPALFMLERLGGGKNYQYLRFLIIDVIEGKPHEWLWTEPPVKEWIEKVKNQQPNVRLDRWRVPFSKQYFYEVKNARKEKQKRIKLDLKQTRELFEQLEVEVKNNSTHEELREQLNSLPENADQQIVDEIRINLERIRRALVTPDSDFEGMIELIVETNPFQYLFMGEYGFASCLSMRAAYFWSAVSNAIDIDKVVIWAKESG
ncbi:MAG: hypothetical protein EU539_07365, partial [Promethearchaeota archaeon]